jgi:hypothetical protein
MKHIIDASTPRISVHLQFTPEEVAAFPHAACLEGVDITLDLPALGHHVVRALRAKTGRCVDAGGALVVARRKAP